MASNPRTRTSAARGLRLARIALDGRTRQSSSAPAIILTDPQGPSPGFAGQMNHQSRVRSLQPCLDSPRQRRARRAVALATVGMVVVRQRVAIAGLLAMAPKVLMRDEPLFAVDPVAVHEVCAALLPAG